MGATRATAIAIFTVALIFGVIQMAANRSRSRSRSNNPVADDKKETIKQLVTIYAEQYDVPVDLAFAVCSQESAFSDPPKLGDAGEVGPMQVTPPAMEDMQRFITLRTGLDTKIETGIIWLKHLIDNAHAALSPGYGLAQPTFGVYRLAVRAYNAGWRGASELNRGWEYLDAVRKTGECKWL